MAGKNKYKKIIIKTIKQVGGKDINICEKGKHFKITAVYRGETRVMVVSKSPSNSCWEKGIGWNVNKYIVKGY